MIRPNQASPKHKLSTQVLNQVDDTNAVISPSHVDFVLTRECGAFSATPLGVPFVVLSALAALVICWTHSEPGQEHSSLGQVFNYMIGFYACGVQSSIFSQQTVAATEGHLTALRAGKTMITAR